MKDRILIVATRCNGLHPEPSTEVYVATSLEEAERFVTLWDESEQTMAGISGGYPGDAFILGEEGKSAADWIVEEEALLVEMQGEEGDEEAA